MHAAIASSALCARPGLTSSCTSLAQGRDHYLHSNCGDRPSLCLTSSCTSLMSSPRGMPVALSMISTLMGASHLALRMSFTRYLGAKFTLHLRWGLCSHSTHCGSKHPNDLQPGGAAAYGRLGCGTSTGQHALWVPAACSSRNVSLRQDDVHPMHRQGALRLSATQ